MNYTHDGSLAALLIKLFFAAAMVPVAVLLILITLGLIFEMFDWTGRMLGALIKKCLDNKFKKRPAK